MDENGHEEKKKGKDKKLGKEKKCTKWVQKQ